MSLFKSHNASLIETQEEIIKELLNNKRKSGIIKSQEEYDIQLQRMLSKITAGKPTMTIREQGEGKPLDDTPLLSSLTSESENQTGQIYSQLHNQTFEEIAYDLNTIFSHINQLDEVIVKNQRLSQSILNNLQLRIKSINNELSKYENLIKYGKTNQIHLETFVDRSNFANNNNLYTDANNTVVADIYHAKFDTQQEAIKLPSISSENTLVNTNGVRLGQINIRKQLGGDLHQLFNPENTIDRAIDTDSETFWAESILVNAPIKIDLGEEYYHINQGAITEIEVSFDYLTEFNEFGFDTFGEYEMDIVGIKYYQTDNPDEEPRYLIKPEDFHRDDITYDTIESQTVKGSISLQFKSITAKRLYIMFNQRHYIKTDFLTSVKDQKNLRLWFNQEDVRYQQNLQQELDNVFERFENDQMQSISKYEYSYGLYNLTLNRNEYQPLGIYVSNEIAAEGNIRIFQLDTTEYHPEVLDGEAITDIEYEVYDGSKWLPILPISKNIVESELLQPKQEGNNYQVTPRFKYKKILKVMKDGIAIPTNEYVDHNNYIRLTNYDQGSVYTISYEPHEDAYEIDFLQEYTENNEVKPRKHTEVFQGSNHNGAITLANYPFIDKAKLNAQPIDYNPTYLKHSLDDYGYLPIEVKLINENGYHITQSMDEHDNGMRIENTTDYFNPEELFLEPYSEDRDVYYQYQVMDNVIQFNRKIADTTRIIVEYPYLVNQVRVKATLRRNINGYYGITPVLEEYSTQFKTLL